jgi:hypothetical protein
MVSPGLVLSSHQKEKKTKKQHNKVSQVQMQYSFSKFFQHAGVIRLLSHQRKREKKESGDSSVNGICGCGLPVRCCQSAVAGGIIYADLRSEFNTHLAPQALFA